MQLPPPTVDPEHVRRAVAEVLSRPEYAPLQPSFFEQVQRWVLEQLGRALEGFGGMGGRPFAWAVILAMLAVFGAVGVWLLKSLQPDRPLAKPLTGAIGWGPDDWAADAEEHERAGRWREALRSRYRELIAQLAAAGLVEETPGRTTGEYLAAIGASVPPARGPATSLTETFEAVWYGNEPAEQARVARLRADASGVRRAAGLREARRAFP